MLDVFFSESSIVDLEQIRDYIAEENRDAAIQLLDDIEATCECFAHNPRIGTQRDDLLPGIRLFPVRKTYAVFYRIHHESIEIVRVVHARQDFGRLFE